MLQKTTAGRSEGFDSNVSCANTGFCLLRGEYDAHDAHTHTRFVTFYSKFEYSFEGGVKSLNSKCNSPFELRALPSHKNFRPF